MLGPLREALLGAPGPRLVDVGGGTGNYSLALRADGWEPLVVDRQPEMLARASAKGLETLAADAQRLPLPDASSDAVMLVSMLHHVDDPAAALAEARRILRPGGRLALMVFTREDVAACWIDDPFPVARAWMTESHPPLVGLLALLPGARRIEVAYADLEDGSLAALASHPERLVAPRWHRQTSYFERLERDHPDELRAGLERLRADLDAGRAPRTPGPRRCWPTNARGDEQNVAMPADRKAVRRPPRPVSIPEQVGPTTERSPPCASRSRDATFRSPTSCVRS